MKYTFVGTHPESLASGRPLVFGDSVDSKELASEDAHLASLLVDAPAPAKPATPTPEA